MPSPDFSTLLSLLDEEATLLQSFVDALTDEQQTLTRHANVADLPAIVAQKAGLYNELQRIGKARDARLSALGYATLAAAVAASAEVAARWQRVSELAKAARRSNETNGRLVRTRMTYNRAALDALRSAHGGAPSVYGADGRY